MEEERLRSSALNSLSHEIPIQCTMNLAYNNSRGGDNDSLRLLVVAIP